MLSDRGVSLVEVVVAMFVLALLSLALIPALIASIKQSASNSILSSATHILSARLDQARGQSSTCSAVTELANATIPDVKDSSGVYLRVSQQIGSCPTSYPGTVTYSVSILRVDTQASLVSATTKIYVQSVN